MKLYKVFLGLVSLSILSGVVKAQSIGLENWPEGKDPQTVGLLIANRFVESPHNSFRPPAPPKSITYPEVCAWYGALKFAEVTQNKTLLNQLEQRFQPFFGEEKHLIPRPWHVDYLDRQKKTGDMHGQAPVMWCAWALLKE